MNLKRQKRIDTKQRILEAAGEIFAEQGFHDAKTQEICRKAGINGAAVNYHFGGKAKLYQAVLERAFLVDRDHDFWEGRRLVDASPDEKLRAYIEALMADLFSEKHPNWHHKLAMREIARPTQAFSSLVEKSVKPVFLRFYEVIREMAPRIDEETAQMAAFNTFGLIIHFYQCRSILKFLCPENQFDSIPSDTVLHDIYDYAKGAIEGLSEKRG